MAVVPTPFTAVVGNFLTAALWNAQVRDGLTFLTHVPVFKGTQTAAQPITNGNGNYQAILLDSETIDTDGGHSTTTNTSRFTAQTAGTYAISGTVAYVQNTTGTRAVGITVNGSIAAQSVSPTLTTANTWSGQVFALVTLAVGDYVELQTWQNSGANPLNTNNAAGLNSALSVFWVSA
jgi:hypothetical protein